MSMAVARTIPSLLVDNLQTTIDFYCGVLGFTVSGTYPSPEEPAWAEVSRDDISFQFFVDPPNGMQTKPRFTGIVHIWGADVKSLAAALEPQVAFEWGSDVAVQGLREFAVRDPDGYLIAFTERA